MSFLGKALKFVVKKVAGRLPVVGTAIGVAEDVAGVFRSRNDERLPLPEQPIFTQHGYGSGESASQSEVRRIYAKFGITPSAETVAAWAPNVHLLEAELKRSQGVMPGGAPLAGRSATTPRKRAKRATRKRATRKRAKRAKGAKRRGRKLKFGTAAWRKKYMRRGR